MTQDISKQEPKQSAASEPQCTHDHLHRMGPGNNYGCDNLSCAFGVYFDKPTPPSASAAQESQDATASGGETELPPIQITDDDWERAKEHCPPHTRDAYAQLACRERQLLAAFSRIAEVEKERDELRDRVTQSARIKCFWCGWMTEPRVEGNNDAEESMRLHVGNCRTHRHTEGG